MRTFTISTTSISRSITETNLVPSTSGSEPFTMVRRRVKKGCMRDFGTRRRGWPRGRPDRRRAQDVRNAKSESRRNSRLNRLFGSTSSGKGQYSHLRSVARRITRNPAAMGVSQAMACSRNRIGWSKPLKARDPGPPARPFPCSAPPVSQPLGARGHACRNRVAVMRIHVQLLARAACSLLDGRRMLMARSQRPGFWSNHERVSGDGSLHVMSAAHHHG